MVRPVVLAALVVTLGSVSALSQTATLPAGHAATSARLTFSTERLARAEALLQRYVDEHQLTGIVALVLQHGRPVFDQAVGWSDREAGRRMAPDTIFRIASQTKALTSAAILLLVEEGRINLNDPVSRFIPEYAKTTVAVTTDKGTTTIPARRSITIRDLLTHTAGISYGTQPDLAPLYEARGLGPAAGFGWYTADKDEPICDTMARLASLPFRSQPGEAWVYGYNTDVLGCVVERAAALALDRFLQTRIFEPLGMNDTHFFLPTDKRHRLAAVYASGRDGRSVRAADDARGQGAYVDGPRRSFSGGAGLLSTAADYARFLEMIRNGGALGSVRILSPRSVALMTTNQSGTLHSSNGLGFGLGFETTDRFGANGLDSAGSFGWGGAYGSVYRVDPDAGVVLLLMIQQLPNATDIRTAFPATIYQALVPDVR